MEPEDRDGFQDDDGAPERDNDADGVTDDADACAMVAGVMENAGCPDVDVDEDGVVDRLDACRSLQGPAENQGCPDGDAIIDRLDRCPSVVGPAENRGCPWPDTDADGVADGEDNCPVEPGPASNAGCPSTKKQLVFLTSDRLVLKEQVLFGAGVATILPQSQRLIANLAEVLKSHPSVRVRIEGHTDAQGDEAQNLALSKARAEAVLNELASLGVRRSQLASDGFGGGRPMGPNDTAAGRQANRRVEFIVIPGDSE
jgi:outer membrane protein OmpA-like peptidoglycan-associated protein